MIKTMNKVKIIDHKGIINRKLILQPMKVAVLEKDMYGNQYRYYFLNEKFSISKKEFDNLNLKCDEDGYYLLPMTHRYNTITTENSPILLYSKENNRLFVHSFIEKTGLYFSYAYEKNPMVQSKLSNIDKNRFYSILDDSEIAFIMMSHAGKHSKVEDMMIDYVDTFYKDLHRRNDILDIKNILNDGLTNKILYVDILNHINKIDDIKQIIKYIKNVIQSNNINDKDRYELIKTFKNIVDKYNNKLVSNEITIPDI